MLIQFSVRNFKTFKEKATLSLVASNYDKDTREADNIIDNEQFNLRILKSAVMYGPNASGKSKFIEALLFMKGYVVSSSKEGQKGDLINVEPFMLSDTARTGGSEFEVIFLFKNAIYRYGFEVDRKQVVSEWLYHRPKTKEIEIFYRNHQKISGHARHFSKGLKLVKEDLIRDNALLLSVAAQFNEDYSVSTIEWFGRMGIISGLREESYKGFSVGQAARPEYKEKILKMVQSADLGIHDMTIETIDPKNIPDNIPEEKRGLIARRFKESGILFSSDIKTLHPIYDDSHKVVGAHPLSMDRDESAGTRKFFALTGPILDSLENGRIMVVDELDMKLHPNLVSEIVGLFNSRELNPKNAQFIFNTHNTNLLSDGLFRRDQVWFIEKDVYGAARLYSLADFKSGDVRKGESFEDNYLRGKYGGTPYLGLFQESAGLYNASK
jgi:AAA15 family ATPase/GTPase